MADPRRLSKSDEYLPHNQKLVSINDMFSRGSLCNHCRPDANISRGDGSLIDELIVCGKATYCCLPPLAPPPHHNTTQTQTPHHPNPSLIKNNRPLVRAQSLVLIPPPFRHQSSAFPIDSTAN